MNKLLLQYTKFAEFLGNILGDNHEIILYEIKPKHSSILFAMNGKFGQNCIGDELDKNSLSYISDRTAYTTNYKIDYLKTDNQDASLIKIATYFIKEDANSLIGILRINSHLLANEPSNALLETLFLSNQPSLPPAMQSSSEHHLAVKMESVPELISQILRENNLIKKEKLTITEKMQVIMELYHIGIFQRKGVIPDVAECLNISEPSVYRYISRIKIEES